VLTGLRASEWGFALTVFLVALFLTVPITALVGPFAFAFMQKRNWRQWYHYLWAGTVVALGATVLAVFWASLSGQLQPVVAAFLSLWAVPIGVTTALVGWAIRRPDRDHQGGNR
jgi:surface polysaccharide O-acyltransferase-like enzyme